MLAKVANATAKRLLDAQTDAFEKQEELIAGMANEMKSTKKEILDDFEDHFQAITKSAMAIAEEQSAFEARLVSLENASSAGGSTRVGSSSATKDIYIRFEPTCMKIKGFSLFYYGAGALEEEEALRWFATFKDNPVIAEYFGLERSERSIPGRVLVGIFKFDFNSSCSSFQQRSKALTAVRDYIRRNPPSSHEGFAALEPSREKKKSNTALGRAKGYLENVIPSSQIQMEWSSGTIYGKAPGHMALVRCQWDFKRGWRAQDGPMKSWSNEEIIAAGFVAAKDFP